MSEQTIQEGLYSIPVQLDKYICRSLGATTIKDLVKNKEVTGLTIKECDKIKANRPDVLILNKDKQIVVFIEMKEPDKLKTEKLQRLAKYQELGVARQVKAKIYMLSDGETFIWINPITGARITDENDKPITRKINPKNLSPEQNKELAEFIAIKRMTDTIPIPVSEDGKYDFQKQKELADKYEQIEEIKRSIAQKILTLSEIIVL